MDIKDLRHFLVIARSPSLTVAAQTIGIAQPSLSQLVKRMEDELGVILLQRMARGSRLTEEGRILSEHAVRVVEDFDRCITDMEDIAGHTKGSVVFGMPPSVSMVLSVPLVETVRHELSDVRIKIVEAISGYIIPWLDDGTVDIAVIYGLNNASQLESKHILDERLYFYSAADAWPFDTPPDQPLSFSKLAEVEMILPSNGLRDTLREFEKQANSQLNVVIEMDAMRQIIELVARGSGYTIFSPAAAQNFVNRGELIRAEIVDPIPTRPVHLVRHTQRVRTQASRAVERLTLQIAGELLKREIWEGQLALDDLD